MNNENPTTNAQTDLLADIVIPFEYASRNQRFLNYLIDNVLMRYGFSRATRPFIALILQYADPELMFRLQRSGYSGIFLIFYLVWAINYTLYYTFCEKLFNGYTLGKLITGTKAVRVDNQPLTWRNAFLRSVTRLVPLEFLSGFGIPLHDSWTHTTVIKSR